jgi:hypothetical protein
MLAAVVAIAGVVTYAAHAKYASRCSQCGRWFAVGTPMVRNGPRAPSDLYRRVCKRNDRRLERATLVDDLNTRIIEGIELQHGGSSMS